MRPSRRARTPPTASTSSRAARARCPRTRWATPGRCQPHIAQGLHRKLYRLSPSDYLELAAVWNGPHLETGEDLEVEDRAPEGVPPFDLPAQPDVYAPDYSPEEVAEIAGKLRQAAGLPDEPTGVVAQDPGMVEKVVDKVTP